jgi:ATP-dependent Clp protease ATP-binding subunit ClpX
MEGVQLEFTEEATREIARKAMRMGTGARGLRAILEAMMLDLMYDLPSISEKIALVRVNAEAVRGEAEPELIPREAKESA